jgi:hypothetical protein
MYGVELAEIKAGQQIVIEHALKNVELEPFDKPVIAITEVRDDDGVTNYLAFQTLSLEPGESGGIGVSWLVPDNAQTNDAYQIRFFVLSSLGPDAESLTFVVDREIKVS